MDDLVKTLMDQISDNDLSDISQQIGADDSTTRSALSSVMPLLMSALANNASKPDGAQSLHNALTNDHDGSILGDLPSFLGNPQSANGAGILGHILGGQQPSVTQGLSQSTGLNSGQTGQLMEIAAPLLMGVLGQQQQQQGFSANALSSFLGGQQQLVQESNPGMTGMLNSLLDMDKDGSALDDLLGMVGKLFGRR
jgi:hypothetical protein